MKTPEQTMYPHEVQIALFKQLLTYETLLKPGFKLRIDRFHNGNLFTYVVKDERSGPPAGVDCWELDHARLHNTQDIDTALQNIWNEVNPKFKIQN